MGEEEGKEGGREEGKEGGREGGKEGKEGREGVHTLYQFACIRGGTIFKKPCIKFAIGVSKICFHCKNTIFAVVMLP